MIEIILAAGIVLALLLIAAWGGFVHWSALLLSGGALLAAGFVAGAVIGIGYHIALYRTLAPLGILKRGWWWKPTGYNRYLPEGKRRSVMRWYYGGVITIVIDFVGCALVLTGILTR